VPPGGKGEFSLVFHSKGYPQGVFTKGIMVRSNAANADPATHMTQLLMVATVGAPNAAPAAAAPAGAAPAVTPPPVSASGLPGQGLRLSHSEILLPPSGLQQQASVFQAYLTLSGLPAGVEPTASWSLPAAAAAAWPQPTLTQRQPGSYRIGLTFPAGWVAPPSAKQTPPPALVLKAGKHEARMTVRTPPTS
jgi:hypothetical protein